MERKKLIRIILVSLVTVIFLSLFLLITTSLIEYESIDVGSSSSLVTQSDDSTIYPILLLVLSATTLLSISISFYLYKWRKILLTNENMVVPEEWAKYLNSVGENLKKMGMDSSKAINQLAKNSQEQTNKVELMTQTYMELQHALDQKDKEIAKLKAGYDSEIYKKFLNRFIRIEQSLSEFLEDEPENSALQFLQRLFDDALAECSVSKFSPEVGDNYRSAFGVSDTPKKVETEDKNKDFQIAEVLESGYQLRNGDSYSVVLPAKVKIYVAN